MSEPPRPPGNNPSDSFPPDPTSAPPPYPGGDPQASSPPAPPEGSPQPGGFPPPDAGYPPPPPPSADPYQPGYAAPPPGGYAAPPQGGYTPPQGGYTAYPGQGGPTPAPPGYANADEKTFALIAHFGGAAGSLISGGVLGFLGPLIAYLVKGQQSQLVRAHAVAALNFQLLWSLIAFVGVLTSCIGIGVIAILAAMAMQIIFGIMAGIKANEGQFQRYPGSPSFFK